MKKIMLLLVAATVVNVAASAQDNRNFKFSVGAELGFATGSFSSSHSIGIGGSAQAEIPLQDKLNGTGYVGILAYNGKSAGSGVKFKGQTIIPVRVGIKYFLTEGIYGGLQAGVGFLSGAATGTAFSYSPQIGYEFKTNNGKAVDATFKYDGYSKNGSIGALGFRLAYIF